MHTVITNWKIGFFRQTKKRNSNTYKMQWCFTFVSVNNYAVISWNKINERCTRKERIVLNALTSRWCSIPRFLSQHTFFWHVKHSLFSFITIFACHFISHATSLVRMTLFRISLNTEGKRFFFWSPSICICVYTASSYDTILVWEEFKWHDGRQVSFLSCDV